MILGQLKIGEPQTKCDVVADANDVEIAAEDEFIRIHNILKLAQLCNSTCSDAGN